MPLQLVRTNIVNLGRFHVALEAVLRVLSLYVIPVGIGILSFVALAVWDSVYQTHGDRPLEFRVLPAPTDTLSPGEARAKLQYRPLVRHFDTKLSEAPVWFTLFVPSRSAEPQMVEFPSRHAVDLACWNADTMQVLGRSSRNNSEGVLASLKSGFALKLEGTESQLLCRASFVGPARLSAALWPADQLAVSVQHYHRRSGLLDGGLAVLAVFALVMAIVNRQSLYVLFAAWLFLNLRVGALSAGWDLQWLGQNIPHDLMPQSRSITIALYAVLTLTLYQTLFRDDLARSRYAIPFKTVQWLCVPLLLSAVILPFKSFLPVMWVCAGSGLLLMTLSVGSIVSQLRTRVALWYALSFGITFLSGLAEVIAAALGVKELVVIVNSVTAALASSVLTALAIAEQMRLEHRQRLEAQAELEHTYEAMPIGLFTLDISGHFLSANPAALAMLGPKVAAGGRNAWARYFADGAWTQLHNMVHTQTDGELELASKDGCRRFLVKATLARGKIEGFLQDVTEKSKANENLRFMANNDPLTKVLNRRGIEKMFDSAASQLAAGKPLALAYLDLDRFKLINDLFGHSAGDEVLKQVCERINVVLSGEHRIGRVGGDEFVIVMPDATIPLASLICRGIVDRIGTLPYRVGDKAFHVRGSIGLIEVGPDIQIKDAMSTADSACREAKNGNGDGLVVYEKNASAFLERKAELDLVEHLSSATATDGLFLEMQPIMSLKAPHDSLNFEVLLRMRDHDGSIIQAGRIIAAAEKSGQTGLVDRWVLSTTLAWIDTNHAHLTRTQFICMNLSGASLNDERFVQDSITLLEQNPRSARRLCIEITESVALHDLDNTRRFINKVRSYGARVGLDDFGAGYTSFSYLKELPADVLKIDGNFIVNINEHPANVTIVEAIVNLAVNLGMKTVAEWAEDGATVKTLAEIGVDYVQGYAIARSQAPEKILAATSSASFIQDENLAQFARMLGASDGTAAQIDMFRSGKHQDFH